jgi:hypothetical protein
LQTLSHDAYLALRADATVLERDLHGEKVLQLADGSYLKLFRRKRLIIFGGLVSLCAAFCRQCD